MLVFLAQNSGDRDFLERDACAVFHHARDLSPSLARPGDRITHRHQLILLLLQKLLIRIRRRSSLNVFLYVAALALADLLFEWQQLFMLHLAYCLLALSVASRVSRQRLVLELALFFLLRRLQSIL